MKKEDTFICVYDRFLEIGLNIQEAYILSVYRFYTEKGGYGCCCISNKDIADKIHVDVRTIQRAKTKFKKYGLISVSGIKVKYLGIKDNINFIVKKDDTGVMGVTNMYEKGDTGVMGGDTGVIPKVTNNVEKGDTGVAPKNNNDINHSHNYNSTEMNHKTNFDVIMENRQLLEFNKPELVEYFKQNNSDIINQINNSDISEGMIVDSIINVIKKKLTTYKVELDNKKKVIIKVDKPESKIVDVVMSDYLLQKEKELEDEANELLKDERFND